MTFHGRLRLFFAIIVLVPMVAIAVVLFALTADSEQGKADAGIATGLDVSLSLYDEGRSEAVDFLRQLQSRPISLRRLRSILRRRDRAVARAELRRFITARQLVAASLFDRRGATIATVGSSDAVAFASTSLLAADRRRLGTLSVSTTAADKLVRTAARRTRPRPTARRPQLEFLLLRRGLPVAATLTRVRTIPQDATEFDAGGRHYRGRRVVAGRTGEVTEELAAFREAAALTSTISEGRLRIAAVLAAFLLLALGSSVLVVRALQGQVARFRAAARRIAEGNFGEKVPVEGRDEFAGLADEFNNMSTQLKGMFGEVVSKRREIEGTRQELEQTQRDAITDSPTGLLNRAGADRLIAEEFDRQRRFGTRIGLVYLDVDHFKEVNDTYDHSQGNEVLAAVAKVLRERTRALDEPARWGGDEFIVILRETDLEGAAQLAEDLRKEIEDLHVPSLRDGPALRVTATLGVASAPECADDAKTLFDGADEALLRAKRAGRNRVERARRRQDK